MKTGITRVRTGCYTCRRRKVKVGTSACFSSAMLLRAYADPSILQCDEAKPECRACSQLDLHCEGYALRYKFCDPQTPNPIPWPATVPGSPNQVPAESESSNQVPYSASLPSVSSIDSGINLSPTLFDNSESPEASPSEDSAQTQSSTLFDGHLSPFYDAFLDTVWNWPDTHTHILGGGKALSPHTNDSSSTHDTTSPSEYGDISRASAMPSISDPTSPPSGPIHISNPSGLREYYFSQWHRTIVPLLPPVFRDITTEMPDFQPLQNAVLAISASYAAHVESLIVRTAHRSRKSYYTPQKDHQYQSLQYYNKVIQGMGKCLEMLPQTNLLDVLAALLLSYYFELDSGSFTGGIRHMAVLDKLLLSHHDEIKSDLTGRKLLSTWMNLRSQFVNRYLGSCIPSMSAHKIDTFPLNRMIIDGGSHHDSMMIMTCEGKLLSRKMILDWCVTRGETRGPNPPLDNILSQMSLPRSRKDSASQLAAIDDSYKKSLLQHRARLDEWHSALDISELPIESYVSRRQDSTTELETLDILPLKFHTFEAAMNYAHYAHTQMLCAHDAVDRIRNPNSVAPPFTRKDCPWGELILRITAGLTIDDCVYKNTFNAGMLLILTSCMVLCPRADVAAWVEDWVQRVEDSGVPLESGLPFGIIKRIIRFILNERQNGSDVLLILPLDTEDAEKSDLYQSDFKMQVVVCGKDLHTGRLYNETVEIPEV